MQAKLAKRVVEVALEHPDCNSAVCPTPSPSFHPDPPSCPPHPGSLPGTHNPDWGIPAYGRQSRPGGFPLRDFFSPNALENTI